MKSSEVIEALRRSLETPPGRRPGPVLRGLLAVEIEAPRAKRTAVRRGRVKTFKTGARSRADALWLANDSQRLVGFEVKCSRADLQVELRDPDKSLPWRKYCSQWWLLLSDAKFAEGLDIPQAWGIASVPTRKGVKRLTVIREAPETVPTADLGPAYSRLISWNNFQQWKRSVGLPVTTLEEFDRGDDEEEEAA